MLPEVPFNNPVIPGFHPDPSVCRVGDDYWLAVSSFEYFPGLPIFHSRDLVNWRLAGHALDRPGQLDLSARRSSEGIFAPTLRHHNGVFYLVTTDIGGIGNFILTAEDPSGQWSDPIQIDEGDAFSWFDPSLLFDEDGKVYYTRRQKFEIVQAEIDVTTGKLLTPLRTVAKPFTSDDIEGPHLYRIDGYYYLMCAEGGTGWGHALSIGRSTSPWGPFEPCPGNPILTHRHLTNHSIRSTGHGDLVQAQDGSWWLVFLATRHREECGFAFHHLGRETFLAPVEWIDGWPVINGGKPIQYKMPGPALPRHPWPALPKRDSFQNRFLDPRWTWRRRPVQGCLQHLPEGGLRLRGQPGSLNDATPLAFLGRRLEQPEFTVRTELEFAPQQDGEEAGLTLFLAEDFHAEIAVLFRDCRRKVIVRRRATDLQAIVHEQDAPEGPLILQISGNWDAFSFSCNKPGQKPLFTQSADRRLLCTEVATGWTGLFAAIYATGNGRNADTGADFSWFELSA